MTELRSDATSAEIGPGGPHYESYARLFWRFLRFGLLAWGGPVAQIAMLQQDLVERERWISHEHFNRVLAVYQVLPGPEATELCVYFGLTARGRVGGLLAGLGFVLPGFLLMLALSWFYVHVGMTSSVFAAIFYGFQPAVAALIVRATQRIGRHALTDRWLWGVMLTTVAAELLQVPFLVTLVSVGLAYLLVRRGFVLPATLLIAGVLLGGTLLMVEQTASDAALSSPQAQLAAASPTLSTLFSSGLRSGLLTFGGAYTVIPYLQHDAVDVGGWMSNTQFLDGLALSGVLPAPLIIFATFVGYLGGGLPGAIVLTIGIFLPAFAITLVGHSYLERLVEQRLAGIFFAGVAAGVVGLIGIAGWELLRTAITDLATFAIFSLALLLLYCWTARVAVVGVMLGAGLLGLLLFQG